MNRTQLVLGAHVAVGLLLLAVGLFRMFSLGQTIPGAINAVIGGVVIWVGRSLVDTMDSSD